MKEDYVTLNEVPKDENFLFCYYCIREEEIKEERNYFGFPVLIYPILQLYFHKTHSLKKKEYMKHKEEMMRSNPPAYLKEFLMVKDKFFQSRHRSDSFDFIPEEGCPAIKNDEFRAYLEVFNEEEQRQIWAWWQKIEKDLRWGVIDRNG